MVDEVENPDLSRKEKPVIPACIPVSPQRDQAFIHVLKTMILSRNT